MDRIDRLYREFGALLRKHRKGKKLSQEYIGKRVGLSRTSITNIEQGRQKILLHQLFDLSDVIQVPPLALLPSSPTAIADKGLERLPRAARKMIKDPRELDWVKRTIQSDTKTDRE